MARRLIALTLLSVALIALIVYAREWLSAPAQEPVTCEPVGVWFSDPVAGHTIWRVVQPPVGHELCTETLC